MYRLTGECDGRFVPLVWHAGHARVGELGAGFAQDDVVELRAIGPADQMHRRHASACVELVADAKIHEEQIVIQVRDHCDERTGAAIGWRRGGVRLNRHERGQEGPRQQ